MRQKRDIAILDRNGRLVTSMSSVLANQGIVKIAQCEVRNSPEKQTKIAKWLITQKIEGTIRVELLKKTNPKFIFDSRIYTHLQYLQKLPYQNSSRSLKTPTSC